nr:MAG TPA: hypothetical protein [Caudoviricetes sp.]
MNREQAKELLPIIQAFAEGKTIQVQEDIDWCYLGNDADFNLNPSRYRIKPSPKYRPFANAEECWQEMQKHQPFGWLKDKEDGHYTLITAINKTNVDQIALNGNTGWLFCSISKFYTFADGTPFGINEE